MNRICSVIGCCLFWGLAGLAPAQTFQTIAQLFVQAITPPTVAPDGNLYLTAFVGEGTGVLQLTPPSDGGTAWTVTSLNIPGGTSPMVPAPGGGFYVAFYGNNTTNSYGAVYLISPPSAPGGAWTQTAIHTFTGPPDGAGPLNLILNQDGSIYGTTGEGGQIAGSCQFGCGTLYQLSPPSAPDGAWTATSLYTFDGVPGDGQYPGDLVAGSDGLFYAQGSGGYCGSVLQFTPPSAPGGLWQEATIYTFPSRNEASGCNPTTLIAAPDGGLYGTASSGGKDPDPGDGTVFALTPPSAPGGAWSENTLFKFTTSRGKGPNGLVLGTDGNLYGTAAVGGQVCYVTDSRHKTQHTCGTVFELVAPSSPGGKWQESTLNIFTGDEFGHDGALPTGLSVGPDGTMYGSTEHSGRGNGGTVFEVVP